MIRPEWETRVCASEKAGCEISYALGPKYIFQKYAEKRLEGNNHQMIVSSRGGAGGQRVVQ